MVNGICVEPASASAWAVANTDFRNDKILVENRGYLGSNEKGVKLVTGFTPRRSENQKDRLILIGGLQFGFLENVVCLRRFLRRGRCSDHQQGDDGSLYDSPHSGTSENSHAAG
jgi:hypothetical protein